MADRRGVTIRVVEDRSAHVRAAVELIMAAAALSIGRRGAFRIALAGGSTPAPIYAALATEAFIDWSRWQLFWGDERCVPPDHPDSNYRMVTETLLSRLAVPPGLVLRMGGEEMPAAAAAAYEEKVRAQVPANPQAASAGLPRFDLILLGMGSDGHTASLFPHAPALAESERLVMATEAPHLPRPRLTMTFPLINAARRVLVLVSGAEKARTLHEVLTAPADPARLPSQGIRPVDGMLTWLVDRAAYAVHAGAAASQS